MTLCAKLAYAEHPSVRLQFKLYLSYLSIFLYYLILSYFILSYLFYLYVYLTIIILSYLILFYLL